MVEIPVWIGMDYAKLKSERDSRRAGCFLADSGFHQRFLLKSDAIRTGGNGQVSGAQKPCGSAQLQLNPRMLPRLPGIFQCK